MRSYCLAFVLSSIALLPGCATPKPVGDAAWQSLFNGKDLTGWVVKCAPADESTTFWKVDDGTILADSMGCKKHDYVWLITQGEYGDFALTLQFQAFRDSPGNSGVQIRSRYDDIARWLDGPRIDINPPGPWSNMTSSDTAHCVFMLFAPALFIAFNAKSKPSSPEP